MKAWLVGVIIPIAGAFLVMLPRCPACVAAQMQSAGALAAMFGAVVAAFHEMEEPG